MPENMIPVPSDQEIAMYEEGACVLIDYDNTYKHLRYGEDVDMYDGCRIYHCSVIGVVEKDLPGRGDGMYSPRPIRVIICRWNSYDHIDR